MMDLFGESARRYDSVCKCLGCTTHKTAIHKVLVEKRTKRLEKKKLKFPDEIMEAGVTLVTYLDSIWMRVWNPRKKWSFIASTPKLPISMP